MTAAPMHRTARSSRPAAPSSVTSSPLMASSSDIENQSAQTMASLGIVKRGSSTSASSRPASSSITPRGVTLRDSLSVISPSDATPLKPQQSRRSSAIYANHGNASPRSRIVSSDGSSVSGYDNHARSPPVTAIRRPAPLTSSQAQQKDRLPSTPLSASLRASKNDPIRLSSRSTSTRSRITSTSASHPHQDANTSIVAISPDDYASLVSLLALREEDLCALQAQLDVNKAEQAKLNERCDALQKERDRLCQQLATNSPVASALPGTSRRLLQNRTNSANGTQDDASNAAALKKELEEVKRQYEMQENLLLGYQRENEKATAEMNAHKKREKHLTEQLRRVYGPSFSIDLAMDTTSPSPAGANAVSSFDSEEILPPATASNRRHSGAMLLQSPPPSLSSLASSSSLSPTTSTTTVPSTKPIPTDTDNATLLRQLVAVQDLVGRFERRLLTRETELIKQEEQARTETLKAEEMIQRLLAHVPPPIVAS